jgi:hypothetical protein
MRGIHTRKRSRPSSGPSNTKRRRRFKRRRTRKTANWTSQSGRGSGLGFSKRRTSKRTFRRLLWNGSTAQPHYRSNNAIVSGFSTPANASQMSCSLFSTRRFGGSSFWTTAGGAINPDGGAIPTFNTTDFTVRGGMYGIRVSNNPDTLDSDKETLNVTVFLIYTSKGFSSANLPTTVAVSWDPSLVQDFQTNIGKIAMKKNFLLHDGDSMAIEKRMIVQRLDTTEYAASISEPIWLVLVGNTASNVTKTLSVTAYYNLSFVGDVV